MQLVMDHTYREYIIWRKNISFLDSEAFRLDPFSIDTIGVAIFT